MLRDGESVVATITIASEETMAEKDQPLWPMVKSPKPTVYLRRVVVSTAYGGRKLGAALLE